MNTKGTRHTATTLTTAAAVAAALTIISASAPTAANALQPDPLAGPAATQCVGTVSNAGAVDNTGIDDSAVEIAHRKAQMAQDYVDHTTELHQPAAR